MNIQRYALPMIVAAGFHSALFLITPDTSFARGKNSTHKRPEPPPPMPKEILAMEDEPEVLVEAVQSCGGAPAPVIPDIPMELPDKAIFTTERTESLNPVTMLGDLPTSIGPGGIGPITPGIPGIRGVGSLDRHPRATAQMSPDYPASLHAQGVSGSVTVEFDVDTVGRVTRAEAVNYTRREFVEPALRAVRNWRFEPGKRNSKVVPFRMTIPIEFKLES